MDNEIRRIVVTRQRFRCANKPGRKLEDIENYECLQWILKNGRFDKYPGSDTLMFFCVRIEEPKLVDNNNLDNFRALCPSCRQVKLHQYRQRRRQGCIMTSKELANRKTVNDLHPAELKRRLKRVGKQVSDDEEYSPSEEESDSDDEYEENEDEIEAEEYQMNADEELIYDDEVEEPDIADDDVIVISSDEEDNEYQNLPGESNSNPHIADCDYDYYPSPINKKRKRESSPSDDDRESTPPLSLPSKKRKQD